MNWLNGSIYPILGTLVEILQEFGVILSAVIDLCVSTYPSRGNREAHSSCNIDTALDGHKDTSGHFESGQYDMLASRQG